MQVKLTFGVSAYAKVLFAGFNFSKQTGQKVFGSIQSLLLRAILMIPSQAELSIVAVVSLVESFKVSSSFKLSVVMEEE